MFYEAFFVSQLCFSLNWHQDLLIAGTDTLEWAMTELLCHPEKITQAQAEIDQVLGKGQARSIEESDISNFPYTKAIVKETLWLHPPAPFLVPHKTESDVQLCGYHVLKNAQVWVNVRYICCNTPNPKGRSVSICL